MLNSDGSGGRWSGRRRLVAGAAVAVVLVGGASALAASRRRVAGPQRDGTSITPYGWTVTPAGRQVTLGDKPFGTTTSPDGKTLLVSNDGQYKQSLMVIDAASGAIRQTLSYTSPEALFVGVVYSPDGKRVYASAGGNNKVRVYEVQGDGTLTESAPIALPTRNPAGATVNHFPAGVTVSADGRTVWTANSLSDSVSMIDVASRTVRVVPVGANPYAVKLSPDGRRAYVSNWGEASVSVLDAATGALRRTIPVGEHPSALLVNARRGELYAADTDSDQLSVIDLSTNTATRTIDLAPYRHAPVGSNPNALALAPDAGTLYVANAGADDIDVIRLAARSHLPRSRAGRHGRSSDVIVGRIPTGWYPTGVEVSRDGRTLYVANAKGLGAGPNPDGPNPYTDARRRPGDAFAAQYIGSMIKGTLSIIATPDAGRLARDSAQVARNNHYPDDGADPAAGRGPAGSSVVPRRPGEAGPIKHVIYVVKENRTYDQVLGSLGKGNGDPKLNLFDDSSAPNIRALARQFVTLDNFYAAAEVSADGWNWSTAATANTYTQKTWEANYSDNGGRNHPYQYEGGSYATAPGKTRNSSYLWDSLDHAGVSYRNFGFWRFGTGPVAPTAPNLAAHTEPSYPGYDLSITDQTRLDAYTKAFQGFAASGSMPRMQFVRLPQDHTRGTTPGAPTPKAMIADNDLAVGRLVDLVSHSRFWKDTAIFVVEDDAQAGPDHVDAHRTEALVVSPYTQHHAVDSTFYSTVSMLRTIELLVGVAPLTQFDAAAIPMLNTFRGKPNQRPYTAMIPSQSLTETNSASAPMAAQSALMNFSDADLANDYQLNLAVWQSVKGASVPMPAGKHATLGTDPDH
jgi:YVTN family beta-propeller protein